MQKSKLGSSQSKGFFPLSMAMTKSSLFMKQTVNSRKTKLVIGNLFKFVLMKMLKLSHFVPFCCQYDTSVSSEQRCQESHTSTWKLWRKTMWTIRWQSDGLADSFYWTFVIFKTLWSSWYIFFHRRKIKYFQLVKNYASKWNHL